jgi:hypothetical protein
VKQRPNLATRPFLDVRPVLVAGGALALVALVLTGISLAEVIGARSREKSAAKALVGLQAKRAELVTRVEQANQKLTGVGWQTLRVETEAMQDVVARRRLIWSQLLADFERMTPWDVRLVSIALLFVDAKFSEPLPASEESPSATNGQGHRFSLSVRYWPEGRS